MDAIILIRDTSDDSVGLTMAERKYGRLSFDASSEQKVMFPEGGITKGDLIDYYEEIADYMLPHVKGRPITMQRFPDGIEEGGFYEKRVPDHFPEWINRVKIKTSEGTQEQVTCENKATLAYLANQACITPHVWLSHAESLREPDEMIFDLDPPEGGEFSAVRNAARRFRELFDEMDVTAFVATTGSKGLHLIVPIRPERDFDEMREVAARMADRLAERYSDELTRQVRKNKREGRLYLDVARNAYGQTGVAPYAVRARGGAPVATPITWDEVESEDIESQTFTIKNIRQRLGEVGDIWSDRYRHRRSLDVLIEKIDKLG